MKNYNDQNNSVGSDLNTSIESNGHHANPHKKEALAYEKIEKTKKGVFGFFVTRLRLTILLLIGIITLGTLALFQIPRESDPEVKIPIAVVTTAFPGASPADIENLVTNKIEDKIEELENVKLVTSSSVLGLSSVTIEFEAEANLQESIRKLKDKVLEVSGLPNEATDPKVIEIRANDTPIITFSLAGPLSENELKDLGEEIQDELEKIKGISEVTLIGVQSREFSVEVDKGSLERFNISLLSVINAISSSSSDTPVGDITIDQTNYNLRLVAKIKSIEDLNKIVVKVVDGQPILLKDIAQVKDQLTEKKSIARLSVNGQESINTISLTILKKTGGNILNIVDTAKTKLENLQKTGVIPASVTVEVSSDYSSFIRKDLRILGSSGVFSVILIFIILFIALSIREATISLIAVPITFLITLFVINFRGDTLNSLVLFSLVLSLGLLVDAFIIILEGIFHNVRIGYTPKEASLLSIAHYRIPLLSGALTTISAFVPMLLVSGILGEYLRVLPITISTVLLSSLFVSLAIVPAIAPIFLKKKKIKNNHDSKPNESLLEKYLTKKLTEKYSRFIHSFLKNRKQKIRFMGIIILALVVSFGLLISPVIKVELFPKTDLEFSFVDIEMPIGTNLEKTNDVVKQVENYLYTRSDIKTFTTSVGSASSFGLISSSSNSENVASINITFTDVKDRELKSYEINNEIREALKTINEGKITLQEISSGPPTGAPIEIRITGDEINVIDDLSVRLVEILKNTPGVIEVESDRQISPADLTFKLNKDALAKSGLSVGEVSGVLRAAIFGLEATEVNVDGEDVDVIVRLKEDNIDSIEKIKNLSLVNAQGQSVKLSRVADFSLEPALATIRHRNFKRTTTVRANLESGYVPTDVVPEVEKNVAKEKIPEGYEFNFGGEVEDIEQSFSELWNAMIVAVLLILGILILQFNSFKKPLIILLTIPLALIGVTIGMLLFKQPFSFSVFLGIISLAGIVVNDAIVLLDKADRNVTEQKMKPVEAIANAGATRLQPIILTSVTTIAGVLPLTWTDEFWFGLSISIIFGIAFATILQLFVVPILYLKLEGKAVLKQLNSPTE